MNLPPYLLVVTIVLAASSTLTGCGPAVTPSTPTAAESSVPDEPQKPVLSELVLTAAGLGTLEIDKPPVVADAATDLLVFNATACASKTPDDPGMWVANYDPVSEGGTPTTPFAALVNAKGAVSRIDVYSLTIKTDEGIGINSSLAEVQAAYGATPSAFVGSAVSDVYAYDGDAGRLLIEMGKEADPEYWAPSSIDHVVGLVTVPLGTKPFAVAQVGSPIGICSAR